MIDISWPLSKKMTPYRKRKLFDFNGKLILDLHAGTHIDAPAHFIRGGKKIDKIPLKNYNGKCSVLDLTKVKSKIEKSDLQKFKILKNDILLLKTKNSKQKHNAKFDPNFVYLDKSAAKYLVSKKVKVVGIDYLGIENHQLKHETHKLLLKAGIVVIEGLRLAGVRSGKYKLICLPLSVGLEAAPARAVLVQESPA